VQSPPHQIHNSHLIDRTTHVTFRTSKTTDIVALEGFQNPAVVFRGPVIPLKFGAEWIPGAWLCVFMTRVLVSHEVKKSLKDQQERSASDSISVAAAEKGTVHSNLVIEVHVFEHTI
jgi:hypothetical protein